MKSISAKQLSQLIDANTPIQLIDVREEYEHADFNIGGIVLPLGQITQHFAEIEKERPVVIYCRKGIRSQIAIQRLQEKFPFTNLINLAGGTEAWKQEFGNAFI
jgi:rhodanese-related sulfurtransferase